MTFSLKLYPRVYAAYLGHAPLEERGMVASSRCLLRLHRIGVWVSRSAGVHKFITDGRIVRRGLRDSKRGSFRVCPVTRRQQIGSSTFYRRAARVMSPDVPRSRIWGRVSNIPPTEFFVLSTASANFCLAFSVPDGMMIG